MADTFKVGDVVVLKSGGPKMTVTQFGSATDGEARVWTAWFDGENNKNASFPAASVEIWKESEATTRIKRG